MTYEDALRQAAAWGATVAVLPRANWAELSGRFSPEQLRAIAAEVERVYRPRPRPRPADRDG